MWLYLATLLTSQEEQGMYSIMLILTDSNNKLPFPQGKLKISSMGICMGKFYVKILLQEEICTVLYMKPLQNFTIFWS